MTRRRKYSKGKYPVAIGAAIVAAQLVTLSTPSWAGDECSPSICGIPTPPPGTPTVVSTKPADGATNVDRDANIKVKFSEKMLKSSVGDPTVGLVQGNFDYDDLNYDPETCPPTICEPPSVALTTSYNAKKKSAKVNPTGRLAANTEYTVVVEGADDFDDDAVKDKAGNEMARDHIWHFTTGAE